MGHDPTQIGSPLVFWGPILSFLFPKSAWQWLIELIGLNTNKNEHTTGQLPPMVLRQILTIK